MHIGGPSLSVNDNGSVESDDLFADGPQSSSTRGSGNLGDSPTDLIAALEEELAGRPSGRRLRKDSPKTAPAPMAGPEPPSNELRALGQELSTAELPILSVSHTDAGNIARGSGQQEQQEQQQEQHRHRPEAQHVNDAETELARQVSRSLPISSAAGKAAARLLTTGSLFRKQIAKAMPRQRSLGRITDALRRRRISSKGSKASSSAATPRAPSLPEGSADGCSEQDPKPSPWAPIIEQLSLLSQNVEVLTTTFARSQQAAVGPPASGMERAYLDNAIDYTDKRPAVEVTVEILNVISVSVTKTSFDACFKVTLDWEEPSFVEGIHFCHDMRSGGFVLSKHLLEDPNSFNPKIAIANSFELKGEDTLDPEERSTIEPKVRRLVMRSSGTESVWLTKEYYFEGTLLCQHMDAHMFPFDMQRLLIKIQSIPQPGLTTLGTERQVRLVNPRLRPAEEAWLRHMAASDRSATGRRLNTTFCVDEHLDGLGTRQVHQWSMVQANGEAQFVQVAEDDFDDAAEPRMKVEVGEMKVCAFGGSMSAYDEYHMEIVVVRTWTAYWFDFYIQMLLIVVSLCSVWVPFNDDTIANRLSISLTVVLSIVFFATVKPAAIGELTYLTWHDRFEHITVFTATLIALENVWVYVECWGMDRADMPEFMLGTTMFLSESFCEEGYLRTSTVDTIFWFFIVSAICTIFLAIMISAQLYQLRFLGRVMHDVNHFASEEESSLGKDTPTAGTTETKNEKSPKRTLFSSLRFGKTPSKASRLSVNVNGGSRVPRFEMRYSDADLAACVASHGLPLVRLIPSFWVAMARTGFHPSNVIKWFAAAWRRKCTCECRCCCCRRKETVVKKHRLSLVQIPRNSFHDMDDPQSPKDIGATSDTWLKRFVGIRPVLSMDEPAYIVDVGTGELGFYQYRWRQALGASEDAKTMLYVESNGKHRMPSDKTFMEEFVEADDGVQRFVSLMLSKFGLDEETVSSMTMTRSSMRMSHFDNGATKNGFRSSNARRKKVKVLVGPTGQNRAQIIACAESATALEQWMRSVEDLFDKTLSSDVLLFVPSEQDEATYELRATEWLVQNGDLDVLNVHEDKNGVPFASPELSQALSRAGRSRAGGGGGSVFMRQDFVREFQDVTDNTLDNEYLESVFDQAAAENLDDVADASAILTQFRRCPRLMRALVKTRLFNGTISAGGGSCQITVKPDLRQRPQRASFINQGSLDNLGTGTMGGTAASLRNSDLHSVKLGNKTPLTGSPPLWSKYEAMTRALVKEWRTAIREVLDDMDLPPKLQGALRGLYVGISAVFYAAELAGCAGVIMPKAAFLEKIEAKLESLLLKGQPAHDQGGRATYDHRAFANLALVYEVVNKVLAESAWIVCKRNWEAQPVETEPGGGDASDAEDSEALPKYVATWSLGFFLNQAV